MEHTMRVKIAKIPTKCRRSLEKTFLWQKSDKIVIKTGFWGKTMLFFYNFI